MSFLAYYNEIDPYAAQWLRNLIEAGHIAAGDVDERSIVDVRPDDLKGYTQCHFFAGIGGWSYAARLAGWPDDRPLWTGSCPCQPFSVAGAGKGQADERHLWPIFFDLIRACNPAVVMGEQVAAAVGKHWLDGVHSDLEDIGYSVGATVVPACAVDAPHRRDRLWFVADADPSERGKVDRLRGRMEGQHAIPQGQETTGRSAPDSQHVAVADTGCADQWRHTRDARAPAVARSGEAWGPDGDPAGGSRDARRSRDDDTGSLGHAIVAGLEGQRGDGNHGDQSGRIDPQPAGSTPSTSYRNSTSWSGADWIAGADGKARRVEPGIRLLAHGVPARVGKLRAYGNAIVPQVAAEVIGAYLDAERIAA